MWSRCFPLSWGFARYSGGVWSEEEAMASPPFAGLSVEDCELWRFIGTGRLLRPLEATNTALFLPLDTAVFFPFES